MKVIQELIEELYSKHEHCFRQYYCSPLELESETLKITISGLVDLCSSYEIAIYLDGTAGTNGTLVKLSDVPRPGPEGLRKYREEGNTVKRDILQPPGELRAQGGRL